MKLILFLSFLSLFQITIFSQEITDEDLKKQILEENISTLDILGNASENACECIKEISIIGITPEIATEKIKTCIDAEVVSYQFALKIQETTTFKEEEKIEIQINTNPNSAEYMKHYYDIERQLMDSCPAIIEVIGQNNKETKNSFSDNPKALELYYKGNDFMRTEDCINALPLYNEAVKIDSTFVFAWDNIGVCNRRLGNYDQAIKAYKKSLKLEPKNLTALQNIPYAYIGKGEYEKAISAYNQLAKIDENNPEVYYGIGVIYYDNLKNKEKALDYMCKAYKIYTTQNSPFRTDAEIVIQTLYSDFEASEETDKFYKILKLNNISINEK